MRATFFSILLAAALCAAASAAEPSTALPAAPWGVFSVASAGGTDRTEVEIASVLIANTAGARPETTWINEKSERVWVARKRVVKAGAADTVQWTDSRACYQLVETLATLTDLDQPAQTPILSLDEPSDAGVVYHLQVAGASAGRPRAIRLANGRDVPVKVLVRSVLDGLGPCWSDAPPSLGANA